MTEIRQVECECPDCHCVLPTEDAVIRDGKPYCGEACACAHEDGSDCCPAPGVSSAGY